MGVARFSLFPVLTLCYFLGSLPRRVFAQMGRFLGGALRLLGFRRKVVRENFALALGKELSAEQIGALAKKFYGNLGQTFLEIARNFSLSAERMREELYLAPEDRRYLDEILARGKGAVVISAHIGNWELFAMGMAAHGYPVAIVVKKMNNFLSQALIERQRLRTGLEVIYSGGAIEKMKAALREGKFVGFMVDQNTTGPKGIRANFFGVPASAIRGLAGMIKETGAPVVPVCAYRLPDGTHRVHVLRELPYLKADNPAESEEQKVLREEWLNTQQYQTAVEELVRRHPEQWLWIHRRWKAPRDPLLFATAHRENQIYVAPVRSPGKSSS